MKFDGQSDKGVVAQKLFYEKERSSGAKEKIENSFHSAYSDLLIDRV